MPLSGVTTNPGLPERVDPTDQQQETQVEKPFLSPAPVASFSAGQPPDSRSRAKSAYLQGRTQTMAIITMCRFVSTFEWTIPWQTKRFSKRSARLSVEPHLRHPAIHTILEQNLRTAKAAISTEKPPRPTLPRKAIPCNDAYTSGVRRASRRPQSPPIDREVGQLPPPSGASLVTPQMPYTLIYTMFLSFSRRKSGCPAVQQEKSANLAESLDFHTVRFR